MSIRSLASVSEAQPDPPYLSWPEIIDKWSEDVSVRQQAAGATVRGAVWRLTPWIDWCFQRKIGPAAALAPGCAEDFANNLWILRHERVHGALASCAALYDWMQRRSTSAHRHPFTPELIDRFRVVNRADWSESIEALPEDRLTALRAPAEYVLQRPLASSQFLLWLHLLSAGAHPYELPTIFASSLLRRPRANFLQLPSGRLHIRSTRALDAWDRHFAHPEQKHLSLTHVDESTHLSAAQTQDAAASFMAVYAPQRNLTHRRRRQPTAPRHVHST